jgi:mannan endo-1,4-beta-mannosidase
VRVFAHATSAAFPVQTGPGDVEYQSLLGLDYVITQAQAYGMKVLLSLADNWKYPGGVDQYVDWSATTPERGAAHPRPPDTEGDTDNTV